MIQQSFGSNYSEVLQEDREILKNVNRQLKRIFIFFAVDIFFCFFCATIDTIFYLYDFIPKLFLEFFFISVIAIAVTILLLLRRKVYCIIAGFSYIIVGGVGWLTKMIYICYLVFGGKVNESFDERYSSQYWNFIIFIIQIGLICLRLYTCYLIKIMYKSLGYFEKYRREKEHAEFLEKLGNKMGDDNEGNNSGNQDNNICEIKFDEEEDQEEYNENQI
jgi:hypothetical protein